jgi:hypothetical protein
MGSLVAILRVVVVEVAVKPVHIELVLAETLPG